MTIQIGDRIPDSTLSVMTPDGAEPLSTSQVFDGRKVVLFSVPGAFTPTCSVKHLPGYVDHLELFKDHGVDTVACLSVNDVFVMNAWGKASGAEGILMLADGNGDFAEALGLQLDARAFGMGWRSQRFALLAENGLVTALFIEDPGEFRVSAAEHMLAHLSGD